MPNNLPNTVVPIYCLQQAFYGHTDTPYRLVNNKVLVPTADEQARNPRSRSAKLRIAEKK